MQKRIIGSEAAVGTADTGLWLDLEPLARVEVSSEDPGHPIEAAFRPGPGSGWRAAGPGLQTIRLIFAQPQALRRIRLVIDEDAHQRTQEFVLSWSADAAGSSYRELLRQQFTFSPPGTIEEVEDYRVELAGVSVITLQIIPDISGRPLIASLAAFQLA